MNHVIKKFPSSVLSNGLAILILFVISSCQMQQDQETEVFSEKYRSYVETLASDEFEGRAPTTPGGRKTKEFIETEFRRMGLKPISGNSYRQPVPLVEITGKNFSDLVIREGNREVFSFSYLDEMVVGTSRLSNKIELVNSELVFAGYGVVAPEYGWNDYEGLDVKGKTVIVLVNDPGYTLESDLFTGRAMTYYGRWTYKYEEAARQGAAGVLIVHDTGPAGYGWEVVRNSWSGPQYELGGGRSLPPVEVGGWISQDVAGSLFSKAGFSIEEAKKSALSSDFKPYSLKLNASVSFDVDYIESTSANIIGYVEGSKRPEETIVYMAHWDHLGKVETPDGFEIYNGAIDNATGVAAIMVIAERFATMKPAPERSVVFMAVTAEESGLLGSKYYASNPLFPLEKTAGGINLDGLDVYGPTHDITVVGYRSSEMQDFLQKHAIAQNRVLRPEKYPERGYFYRSDHFSLVKMGVPMLYANSGEDYIGRDEEFARMVSEDVEGRYHAFTDVIHDLWDWSGLHQNLWLFYNIGKDLANTNQWPEWSEGNEFKAIREKTDNMRK